MAIAELKKDYLYELVEGGKRADGRKFDEYRKISLEKNLIANAEGSARVGLGNTDVLVGIKLELGEPYPDAPEKGVLTTSAELVPIASPAFESGPPSPEAIELARVVDRGIRESESINLAKLCITPKEKVWIVFVDIHVLDYDGNLFDASALAAIAALTTTRVPADRFGLGEPFNLPLEHFPISCTSIKLGEAIMLDPCLDEERAASARITVVLDENNNICATQKGLKGSFIQEEVNKILEISKRRSNEVRKLIK
ncbi:MAG: exosome complex protein Rrp42 [Candidatus Thermoplasmatota archaeon]|nr:exosome complex protein Rrp42 [Candidatus Thermoplasmatota archaeon]